MDALIGLFLLVAAICVVVGPVLAIIALVRMRTLERRLERLTELELQVSRLTRRVERSAQPAVEPHAPATPDDAVRTGVPTQQDRPPEVAAPPPPKPPPSASVPHVPGLPGKPPTPPPVTPATRPTDRPPTPPPVTPATRPTGGPPAPPSAPIDLERWIGIRGAAVVGAVALGLAGLLFFKYSIEQGLITPTMRVVLGTVVGLACLVGSEWLRRRDHRHLAEGLSGAGVVILYAAFWAAHVLYALIGMAAAFALMLLVTVTCCLLALRHAAFVVAVIGLVGGFATPLLLSSGTDRPIGLFGYVLLLDLGLLALGHKRGWPSLGLLSLLATVLIQALWIGERMGPDRFALGLVILGLFAVVFVVGARLAATDTGRRTWRWSEAGAILFPFAFALYLASRTDLGPHLYPIAILMALLGAAACWVSRERGEQTLALGAAASTVAVVGVWLLQHRLDYAASFEVVAVAAGLSILFHLFVERDRETPMLDGPAPAALVVAAGMFVVLLLAAVNTTGVPPWPWLVGWTALTALLYRHAEFPDRGFLQLAAAAGVAVGLASLHLAHHGRPGFPEPPLYLGVLVGAAVTFQVLALSRPRGELRRLADVASAAPPLILLVSLAFSRLMPATEPTVALVAPLLLGLLAALAATRLGSGIAYAAAVGASWLAQASWIALRPDLANRAAESSSAFVLAGLTVVVFTAWPFLAAPRFSSTRTAWYAAALTGPLWFFPLKRLFESAFGDSFIGVLPVALGALALAATARTRTHGSPDRSQRLSALVWFSAVALGFVSIAIPLQLEKEWITIGWALEGLAVLALWRRLDHPGLKYFGLVLLAAASVRLVANPALLGYYQRSATRFFNWLLYTYLVPASALLASAALLRPLEVPRLRPAEREFYSRPWPIGANLAGVAALMVVFVWINLSIADWFSTGPLLTLSFGETPAQRLTVSLAWAVYALLLLVSFLYQRFVFRKAKSEA
jgi:uncharacterized membrane protein